MSPMAPDRRGSEPSTLTLSYQCLGTGLAFDGWTSPSGSDRPLPFCGGSCMTPTPCHLLHCRALATAALLNLTLVFVGRRPSAGGGPQRHGSSRLFLVPTPLD